MAIFNKDMIDLATRNTYWQREVYRDARVQIVLMSIPAGEEIGMEKHPADQSTFIVAGDGRVVVDGKSTKVAANHLVVIPKGSEHNVINKGADALKLYSVYAPPAEPDGVAFRTKKAAEDAENGLIGRAVEKSVGEVKKAVGG